MFYIFLFFLLLCSPNPIFPSSVLLWDNLQNSLYEYRSHIIDQTDAMQIRRNDDYSGSFWISTFTYKLHPWPNRYLYQTGNAQCPLLNDGSCGIRYTYSYRCHCGASGNCNTCWNSGVNPCQCPLFYANSYELFYLNQDIYTTSSANQFQITIEAKGSGVLNIFALFPANSCPNNILMRTINKGIYGSSAYPIQQLTLTNDFKEYDFIYTHSDYSCQLRAKNCIIIGIHGLSFNFKSIVVTDPQKPIEEDNFLAWSQRNLIFSAMYITASRLIKVVSFENWNSFNFKNTANTYYMIDTIIGSSKGSTSLETVLPITNIKPIGENNVLTCGCDGSNLYAGSNLTTFTINNIQGKCTLINFSNDNNDILNLINFNMYHNYTQIQNFINNTCGDNCVQINIVKTQIKIQGITIDQAPFMKINFMNYPCFTACPDCRLPSDCNRCGNCTTSLCDLEGCHRCLSPYFISFGLCVEQCPMGSYIDKINGICYQCNINYCSECDKDLQCKTCINNTLLYQYICYVSCPERTYSDIDSLARKVCIDCSSNCNLCNNMGCLICDLGYTKFIDNNQRFICILADCPIYQRYNPSGNCENISSDTILIISQSNDIQVQTEINDKKTSLLNQTNNNFYSDSLSYLLIDYDISKHFICQTSLSALSMTGCSCYTKTRPINLGFLAISAIFMKMLHKTNFIDLCGATSSVFDLQCYYNTDNLDIILDNSLIFLEEVTVSTSFTDRTYDIEKMWYLFNKLRGNNDYYVLMKVIDRNRIADYLLLQWELQFFNDALLSFISKEIFIISDPYNGCKDTSKRRFMLNFTYGLNDSFRIKSFVIFQKKTSNLPYLALLNDSICKNYIKSNEFCKIEDSEFDALYIKHASRASEWSYKWNYFSPAVKCALLDIFFEIGDRKILQVPEFKSYMELLDFNQLFTCDNNEYQLNWKDNERVQRDLGIIVTENIPHINNNTDCVITVSDVEIERSCSLDKIQNLTQQLMIYMIESNNSAFEQFNSSNFTNLIINTTNNIFLLEKKITIPAFSLVLEQNPLINFTVTSGLRTLPEQYLLYQWQRICNNISNVMGINETFNDLSGSVIEIENYLEVKDAMTSMNFTWGGNLNPKRFTYSGTDALDMKNENIISFQTLWSCNSEGYSVIVDGVFSSAVLKMVKKIDIRGFNITC